MLNFSVKVSLKLVYADDEVYAESLARNSIPTEQDELQGKNKKQSQVKYTALAKSL